MNLYDRLRELKDFRRAEGKRHNLADVMLIVIMANMSGYFGIRAIGDFIKRNERDLLKIFNPKSSKFPCFQTVGRILQNVDFKEFLELFRTWLKDNVSKSDYIAIDGKAIKGTLKNAKNAKQEYINLVSAFSHGNKEILGVEEVNNKKESEIPKVRNLIKALKLEGVVFTIDALHCQKKTTKVIKETNNDYIIGLKQNQKKLYNAVKKNGKQQSN